MRSTPGSGTGKTMLPPDTRTASTAGHDAIAASVMLPAEHALVQRIRKAYDRLTPGQHRIVQLVLEAPHEAAFLSAAELGRRAKVSDSTVVRLPAVLGYTGYPEFRQELQATLVERLAPVELLKKRLREGAGPDSTFAIEIENLKAVREATAPELIDRAVEIILGARNIYVIGQRSGFGLAHTCAHYLRQVRGRVRLLSFLGGSIPDELADVTQLDTLIAFSTTRYSRLILQVAQYVSRMGARVIAITDSPLAPLANSSDVTLVTPVRSASFFPSNVAALAIVQVLISEVARRRPKRATSRLTAVDRIADDFNVLMTRPESVKDRGDDR